MKLIGSITLFGAVALAHPTGLWWGTDFCYPSPENTDNHCSVAQESGFDWSDLANGDNWSYEGFSFNGFTPKDGCRASGGQCIEGRLSRDDDWDLQIDAEQAPFSVSNFHITTSRDADIILTYALADGSSCHQVASTTPEGSDVVNDQCGGAVSVNFQLSVLDQFGDLDLELHQMGFDCAPGPKPAGPLVITSSETTSATPQIPTSTPIVPSFKSSTDTVEVAISTSSPPVITPSVVVITDVVTVTRCSPTVTDCPDHIPASVTTSTQPNAATDSVKESTHTIAPPALTTSVVPSLSSTPPCPDLVPKCLNTWLSIPKCDSNSDAACFCPSSEFTAKFKSCVYAWSSSQQQTDSALSYFAGICAPYIPTNPAIISLVPTSTPSTSRPLEHVTDGPSPTEAIVSNTSGPEPPCTTVTWSSQTVTVPQVAFSTSVDASTTVVSLVTGNPITKSDTSSSPWPHSTCTSSFTKVKVETSTTSSNETPTAPANPPPKPTSTVVVSNTASKVLPGSLLTLGLAIFIFSFSINL